MSLWKRLRFVSDSCSFTISTNAKITTDKVVPNIQSRLSMITALTKLLPDYCDSL